MVEPAIFGPNLWKSIHYIAIGAPKKFNQNDKNNYKLFFKNLEHWIPCEVCSQHYKKTRDIYDINNYLDSNESLFKYTFQLHNIVNKMLGKKEIEYEYARSLYINNKSSNILSNLTIKDWIILLLIIILFILFILFIFIR